MSDFLPPENGFHLNRRSLLKTAAAASVAFAAPALLRGQDPTKGGKRYRTALIGCGWWGGNIVREAIASGQCQIVALCDVDLKQVERIKGEQKELTADAPKVYQDFRELIDKEKPEIVINATPDHWHPLITIAAVNAGADVYVEKPVGHTILEGCRSVRIAASRRTIFRDANFCGQEKRERLGWFAPSSIMEATRKSRLKIRTPTRDSTGTCGADRVRCVLIVQSSTPKVFGIFWIMPMEHWATGESIGWIRFCGSWTKKPLARFFDGGAGDQRTRSQYRYRTDQRCPRSSDRQLRFRAVHGGLGTSAILGKQRGKG